MVKIKRHAIGKVLRTQLSISAILLGNLEDRKMILAVEKRLSIASYRLDNYHIEGTMYCSWILGRWVRYAWEGRKHTPKNNNNNPVIISLTIKANGMYC